MMEAKVKTDFLNKNILKIGKLIKKKSQQLRSVIVFSEDPCLVHSTHGRGLKSVCNSREFVVLAYVGTPTTTCTFTHIYTHTNL